MFLGYLDGLGDAVEQGLVKAVGVSNYSGIISICFFLLTDAYLMNFQIHYTYCCAIFQRSGFVMLMKDSKREEFLWPQIKSTTV